MEMPKPNKFHKKLQALVGDWTGDEVMHPSPWDPQGGKRKGKIKARWICDGFAVAEDYEQRSGSKVAFLGHGVFGYDPQDGKYLWHWTDSMGGMPPTVLKGTWEGNSLIWINQTPMGHGRMTHTFLRGGKLKFTIEMSADGQQWAPMMEGLYVRKATK